MAVVASLDIVMRAQTDQATGKLMKSVDVLGRLKTALIGAAGAYLSFAGAQRLFSGTLQGLSRLDDLAENADKLGISANSLRVLGNAAELAGGSMETVIRAVATMQRNLGNALSAKGPTVFDRIGVSVRELIQLSPEQQFVKLSEAIMNLDSQAEQAAATQAIFGKDLANLMRNAGESIADSADFVRRFNAELSATDIGKVGLAQDAWDQLRQAIALAWENLSVRFAPALAVMATSLTRLIEILNSFGSIAAAVFSSGAAKAALFVTVMASTAVVIPLVTSAVVALGKAILALARAQTISQALLGPKGWAAIALSVGVAAVAVKMIDAEIDAFNQKMDELQGKGKVQLKFEAIDNIPDFEQLNQLEKKVITLRVNQEPIERGSQEDLTRKLAVDLKVERDVEKQQLDEQKNGNQILQDILEEMRKQTENMTGDADL